MGRPKRKTRAELPPLQRHTLRERAAAVIRRHIVSVELQPGDPLPTERALSESLAVSRTVVREALAVLESQGVLECRPSVGYFVKELARAGDGALAQEAQGLLDQAFEARVALELGVLYIVVPRLTDAELDRLTTMAATVDAAMDDQRATAAVELEFHLALVELSNNPMLISLGRQVIADYFRLLALCRPQGLINPPDTEGRRHVPLVAALRTRDPRTAQDALWEHCQPPSPA